MERGESMGILSIPATRKYKHTFKDIVNSMLNNTFEKKYSRLGANVPRPIVNLEGGNMNTSKMESTLNRIYHKKTDTVITLGRKTIVKSGNVTKIYEH